MSASHELGKFGPVREWLRGLEVFAGPLAEFDPADAPAEPAELFLDWLKHAVAAGVPDPHAMTLSTVSHDGGPDARVLILKNVDLRGWQFAAHANSPKGRQLAKMPRAALTFYWALQGRAGHITQALRIHPDDKNPKRDVRFVDEVDRILCLPELSPWMT